MEISIIIKSYGELILTIPFVWEEHEIPFDFSRFSSYGITELLNSNEFEIQQIVKDTESIESIAILLIVYIVNNLIPKIPGIGFIINILFCSPIQIIATLFQRISPDKNRLYLNLIVKAKKDNLTFLNLTNNIY